MQTVCTSALMAQDNIMSMQFTCFINIRILLPNLQTHQPIHYVIPCRFTWCNYVMNIDIIIFKILCVLIFFNSKHYINIFIRFLIPQNIRIEYSIKFLCWLEPEIFRIPYFILAILKIQNGVLLEGLKLQTPSFSDRQVPFEAA